MKHPAQKRILLQVILLGLIEMTILISLIFVLGWAARQHWPSLARTAVFLAGFGVFALPMVMAIQLPFRRPAWLDEVAAQGKPTAAILLENPYLGEEWQPSQEDRIVSLPVRLEDGAATWVTCTLGEAHRLGLAEHVAICYDPARPERCALAPIPESVEA